MREHKKERGKKMTELAPPQLDQALIAYRSQKNFQAFQKDFSKSFSEEDALKAAKSFEEVFVNNFLKNIFKEVDTNPYGENSNADNIYQDFLIDEYSKQIVSSGGVGIADQVYKQLTQVQGVQSHVAKR